MYKNKQDYLIKTLVLQFVVSAIISVAFFSAEYFDLPFLRTFKNAFLGELNQKITADEVKDVFKNFETYTEEFILIDYSDEDFVATVLGEGGDDIEINDTENVSFEEYKFNYQIFKPVIDAEISSEFGERIHPISGNLGIHKGIDFALEKGSSIYAIYDGEIIEADYDEWNGNYIKIKHDNKIMSVYCHCDKLLVKKGDIIRGGEKIATVGSTGQSTGPHLHFELRINNVSYNPIYALKDAKNAV